MNHFRHVYRIDVAGDEEFVIDDQYYSDFQSKEDHALRELASFDGVWTGHACSDEYYDGKSVTRTYLQTLCVRGGKLTIEDWSQDWEQRLEVLNDANIASDIEAYRTRQEFNQKLTRNMGV